MAKKEESTEQLTPQQQKLKALQAAMAKIEKDFGKGAIMRMGEENIENVEAIPTGSIGLNAALGVGGYPKGRIIEIYGPESSGKTTLAIHAIAECQKAGGVAAFIDAEHAFDRFYAANLGVDIDNRCRACLRPFLCCKLRRRHRQPVYFTARQWRAGLGYCRRADPLECD